MSLVKSNSEHSTAERILVSLVTFIVFSIIAGAVWYIIGPINVESVNPELYELLPIMFVVGAVAALVAYFNPKLFKIILIIIPIPGGGN